MNFCIARYTQRRQQLRVDELDLVRRDFASRFDKLKPNRRCSSRTSISTLASSFNSTLSIQRAEEYVPRRDGSLAESTDWIKDRWQVLMEDTTRVG